MKIKDLLTKPLKLAEGYDTEAGAQTVTLEQFLQMRETHLAELERIYLDSRLFHIVEFGEPSIDQQKVVETYYTERTGVLAFLDRLEVDTSAIAAEEKTEIQELLSGLFSLYDGFSKEDTDASKKLDHPAEQDSSAERYAGHAARFMETLRAARGKMGYENTPVSPQESAGEQRKFYVQGLQRAGAVKRLSENTSNMWTDAADLLKEAAGRIGMNIDSRFRG